MTLIFLTVFNPPIVTPWGPKTHGGDIWETNAIF